MGVVFEEAGCTEIFWKTLRLWSKVFLARSRKNQIIAFKLRLYYFYYVLLSRPHCVIPIKLKWNKNDTRRVMTMLLRTTSTETLNKSPCFRDKSMRSHSAKRKNRYKCSSIPTCVRMFEWQSWSDIVRVSGSKKQKKEKKKETEGAAA